MLLDEVLAGHVLDLGRSGEADRGLCSLFGRDRKQIRRATKQPADEAVGPKNLGIHKAGMKGIDGDAGSRKPAGELSREQDIREL